MDSDLPERITGLGFAHERLESGAVLILVSTGNEVLGRICGGSDAQRCCRE